jgi:Uma2 family endonuclease
VFFDAKVKVRQLTPSSTWLAVEVSDSTLAYDTGRKAKLYARHGIPVLWVINVNTLDIQVFEKPEPEGYGAVRIVGQGEAIAPDFAPELLLKLGELPLI